MEISEYKFANITTRPLLTLADVSNRWIFTDKTRHIIDMCDYRDPDVVNAIKAKGASFDWFPTDERPMDVDMVLLAVRELSRYDYDGSHIIVHCMGGTNRSRTVVEAYYFAKYCEHYDDEYKGSKNHLIWNCEQGYLPPLSEMEKMLKTLSPRPYSIETFGDYEDVTWSCISSLSENEWRVFNDLGKEFPDMNTNKLLEMTFKQTERYELEAEFPKMWARLVNALQRIKKMESIINNSKS